MPAAPASRNILHATCVACEARGLLILGASGSGKSSLALQLLAYGAELVADDRVELWREGQSVIAAAPAAIKGLIEARGLGLLNAVATGPIEVAIVVDLDQLESDRLPAQIEIDLMGLQLPLFKRVDAPHFAPALLQLLKNGALDPDAKP